jgi:predicted dehydrogenase
MSFPNIYNTMKSQTNKLRFGLVGTNFITDWVIAGARQDERFEPTAIYSRTQERAGAFAAKNNILHTFTSLEEMARSPLIDAVYIASPNFLHASQSVLCMQQGKHVLCEKPLASNAREAQDMIDTARKYNVTLMEAMKPTLTPNFLALRSYLHRVGKVRRYFAGYCQYSSRYDKFKEGALPNAFNPAFSNGAMMDIGIYTVYPMVALFGAPQKIDAAGIVLSSGTDGQGTVNFLYDGMNATVLYSKIADSSLPVEIQGEEGNILLDRINTIGRVSFIPRIRAASGKSCPSSPVDISARTDRDEYYYEVAEFINLVQAGKRESDINSHANSLTTLRIIDEVRRQLGVVFPADIS